MPEEFLRMIAVHELAHIKERGHDKAFYQLCRHMTADYHQLEFDLRSYLCYLDNKGKPLWSPSTGNESESGGDRGSGGGNIGRNIGKIAGQAPG